MQKLILVDTNSLLHRAYHALPNLSSSKGLHTGAIFGLLTLLLKIIKEEQPTHLACAFDLKGPTFRHKLYDAYKGTRKPMDAELAEQFEPAKRLLSAMGIAIVSKAGFEADDILGTLARRMDIPTLIVTGDRDSFQLVSPTTKIMRTMKGVSEVEIIDLDRLKEDGFTPSTFIDYKALMGDSSDNIPGVSGVGEKTAKTLLATYGDLDTVLARSDEVKGKLGETLSASKEIALLSRTLATIDTNVPIDTKLSDLEFNPVFPPAVKSVLSELEITSLMKRMEFEVGDADFEDDTLDIIETIVLTDLNDCEKVVSGDKLAVYIDSAVHFSFDGKTDYVIEGAVDLFSEGMTFDDALDFVKSAAKGRTLICFDFKTLSKSYGFDGDFFDVMIASHLAKGSVAVKNVESLAKGDQKPSASMLFGLQKTLSDSLKSQNLFDLFKDIEQPLAVILRDMELRGICADSGHLKLLEGKYSGILQSLSERIFEAAGTTFNISSPKQLAEVLFDKLQLPHGKKNKSGLSVNEDTLLALKEKYPIAGLVLEFRHYAKLQSTYVVGLQNVIQSGRIHTDFNQCITATGRLSSSSPNLQNIPVRGDEAKDVKSAFTASPGNVLVGADYSQIELRLLAHFSGEPSLVQAYKDGKDFHALTASELLGKPIEEVTPAERRDAKAVNFGIIYGMSDFGLSESLSIPRRMAKEYIDRYFSTYPAVRAYLDQTIKDAKEKGFATTLLGRKRLLPDINSSNFLLRSSAERLAMNTPLQGSAADIVKLAMLRVEKRLHGMKSKMILQIHDELIVDATADEAEEVKEILRTEMSAVATLKVPLVAEAYSAKNWGDLK
jgi:DNA polymerase-1